MILITGANGFVGRGLIRRLARDGLPIRGAVRRRSSDVPPDTVTVGDIDAQTDWRSALAEVHGIVHLAGLAHGLGAESHADPRPYFAVNTDGTLALARAAVRAGVKRFVFVSSVKVYGDDTHGRVLTETDPPHPDDPYGQSKWQSEQGLAAMGADTGLEVVILRPPLIYGPGVRANFARLIDWAAGGVPLPLAGITNRRSLLSITNLSAAVKLTLEHPGAAGETFNVSDGEDVSTPELVRRLAHALGRKPRLLPCPTGVLRALARIAGRAGDYDRLASDLAIDSSHIRAHLGYRPPQTLDAGLAEVAAWYQSKGAAA